MCSFVSDAMLPLLLEDDRLARRLSVVEQEIQSELEYVGQLEPELWKVVADSVQAGYLHERRRELRRPPWDFAGQCGR